MSFLPSAGPIAGVLAATGNSFAPSTPQFAMPAAPKRSTGQRIAGILSEALAGLGGGHSGYLATILKERQDAQEEQSLLRRSMLEAQIKAAYPTPAQPTNTQRTYEYLKSIRPELADQYLTTAASGPPLAIDSVDGAGNTVRSYVRPGQLGQSSGAPQAPVGKLTPMQGGAGASPRTFR